jgi:putative DNA primase/helicase
MIRFTLYTSNTSGNLSNCVYPKEILVTNKASMIDAIRYDHVSANFKNNYRSTSNFIKSDNAVLDCDNDHSDDPKDWVTVADVATTFEDIPFVAAYSRNHMKQKGNKNTKAEVSCIFHD